MKQMSIRAPIRLICFVRSCIAPHSHAQLLGHRDSIVAYTGDTSRIGSPCVDSLVEAGTVLEAITYDAACFSNITDNEVLISEGVEVSRKDDSD